MSRATPSETAEGGQYRIPSSGWFGNSLLLDFTNPDAVDWWMSKRAYLFDDIGIDGFKTDGGEMVWGRNASFYDGSDGLKMRNEYPNAYIEAYYDFAEENTGTGMTFSRAGTARRPSPPAYSGLVTSPPPLTHCKIRSAPV